MRKIAMLNQKGGVAKTTSTLNIGAGLHLQKKRVCLIDMDPQAHLTKGLGLWEPDLMTVYDLIRAKAPLDAVRISRGGLDVLPAGPEMAMADLELGGEIGRERKLEKALKKMDGYDFVVIDCPPALNLLTINALTFAREVWIPLEPEFYALEGVTQLLKTVDLVKDSMNPELAVTGVVVTKYNASRNLTKEVESQIREHFKDRVFRTRIRVCVALAEAPASGQTIFEYDSKSNGAVDYESLCQEIVKGDRQ